MLVTKKARNAPVGKRERRLAVVRSRVPRERRRFQDADHEKQASTLERRSECSSRYQ